MIDFEMIGWMVMGIVYLAILIYAISAVYGIHKYFKDIKK